MTSRIRSLQLADRVAVITGAGSGIGAAAAQRFAAEGAVVVVADVRKQQADAVVAGIEESGGRALACAVDVSQPDEVRTMIDCAVDNFGRLDILFNNAAIGKRGTAVTLAADDWTRVWDTNVSSVFYAAKYAIPLMAGRGGVILSTASTSGLRGERSMVAYCATKAAVINLTRALAVDCAELGIRVNCLCPGITETPSLVHAIGESGQLHDRAEAAQPVGRIAHPQEIAAAALWLVSDESSFVTGHSMVVDGGLSAQSQFSLALREGSATPSES